MKPDPHIADGDLILALDGELPAARQSEVGDHLNRCWECRARRAQLERAIQDYLISQRNAAPSAAPAAGPTARLRAALALELSREQPAVPRSGWRAAAAAAIMVPCAVAMLLWIGANRLEASGPLPDTRLTPGAVRFISPQQVCGVAPEDEGRLVPADLARRVFEQYHIANPQPRAYEVDYLISPALGGATAIQNLWPVPYSGGVWTSRVKDALEDRLRHLVCDGKLDLATAQQELASNWIAAYRRHFGTSTPVAAHALFVKDSPWE